MKFCSIRSSTKIYITKYTKKKFNEKFINKWYVTNFICLPFRSSEYKESSQIYY